MDYVEVFKELRTNIKYGRKSPHKAILMLTVIELYEQNVLTENEIFYDEKLKSMFLKIWNRVFPDEPLFHSEAYLPFWYLQSDSFWHIIPFRGKEDILSLMRDANIKPSEAKLLDSVKSVELDDDLYFLMTISSGRSSLKRALLETYTTLSEEQIDKLAESTDNLVDHSLSAMNEYERILSSADNHETEVNNGSSREIVQQFRNLNDDIQIALNYEYYSFLKSHRSERDMLRKACPDVYALYDCLVNHPIHQADISPSFAFIYENFLCDLKIALMSENNSMGIIDKIDNAIAILRGKDVVDDSQETEKNDAADIIEEKEFAPVDNQGNDDGVLEVEHVYLDSSYNVINTRTSSSLDVTSEEKSAKESRNGKTWTQEEEELLTRYFQRGNDTSAIAEIFGRSEVAIKVRLAKLGLIEYTYGKDEPSEKSVANTAASIDDFKIENSSLKCYILNKDGERVYTTEGKMKFLNRKIYRLNIKYECFTVKRMEYNGGVWMKGCKKIVAYPQSELYNIIDKSINPCEIVQDIKDSTIFEECRIKVNGLWYDYKGELVTEDTDTIEKSNATTVSDVDKQKIVKHPLYEERKQALLRALGYFRLPAKIKDIARTISRTAWGAPIKEDDVEDVINTIKEIESVEGKFVLRKK
jgi:hypothetical protein